MNGNRFIQLTTVKYPIGEQSNNESSRLAKGFLRNGLRTVKSSSGERKIPLSEGGYSSAGVACGGQWFIPPHPILAAAVEERLLVPGSVPQS
jgi:hypothetical protein